METIQLQTILKMCDQAVGYEGDPNDKDDHVIAKRTWSKYVQDYNQLNGPTENVQRFGKTSGAKYLISDVEKVIVEKKKALEKCYVDKTMLLSFDPNFETQIERLIKKRVKDNQWKVKYVPDVVKKNEAQEYLKLTIAEKWEFELREHSKSKGDNSSLLQRVTRKSVNQKMQELSSEDESIGEEIVKNCKEQILSMFDIEAFAQDIYDELYVYGEQDDEEGEKRRKRINAPIVYLKKK